MQHLNHYIDGSWRPGAGERLTVINPATAAAIADFPAGTDADVAAAVNSAQLATDAWANATLEERLGVLDAAVARVEERVEELATLEMLEMGRPLSVGVPWITGAAAGFRASLELARSYPFSVQNGTNTIIRRHPIGVAALIAPWNSPTNIIMTALGPLLASGNTVVLKPSEKSALSGTRLVELLDLPAGVLNLVLGDGRAGEALSNHPSVGFVNFTGSVRTGTAIATAGAAHLRRTWLELGGKDPAIVDSGVDVDRVARDVAMGAFKNTGQICASIERIYVHREVAAAFVDALVAEATEYKYGNPALGDAPLGPMVDEKQRRIVAAHVEDAIARGATLRMGGFVPEETGFFYPATILTDVNEEMLVMQEETFGPVAPIQIVDSFEEALQRASQSPYGLAATVYTEDEAHIREAHRLPVGVTWINRWQGAGMNMVYEPAGISGLGSIGHYASFDAATRPAAIVRNSLP